MGTSNGKRPSSPSRRPSRGRGNTATAEGGVPLLAEKRREQRKQEAHEHQQQQLSQQHQRGRTTTTTTERERGARRVREEEQPQQQRRSHHHQEDQQQRRRGRAGDERPSEESRARSKSHSAPTAHNTAASSTVPQSVTSSFHPGSTISSTLSASCYSFSSDQSSGPSTVSRNTRASGGPSTVSRNTPSTRSLYSSSSSYTSRSSVGSTRSSKATKRAAFTVKLTSLFAGLAGAFAVLELHRAGRLQIPNTGLGLLSSMAVMNMPALSNSSSTRADRVARSKKARRRLDATSRRAFEAADSFSTVLLGDNSNTAQNDEEADASSRGRRSMSLTEVGQLSLKYEDDDGTGRCASDPDAHPLWTFVDLFLVMSDMPRQAPLVPFLLKGIDSHLPCYRNLVVLAKPGDEAVEALFHTRHRALFEYANPPAAVNDNDWEEYALLTADAYVYAPHVLILYPDEAFCANAGGNALSNYFDEDGGNKVIVPYQPDDVAFDSPLTKKFRRGSNAALRVDRPLPYNFVNASPGKRGMGPSAYPRWLFAELRARLRDKHHAANLVEFYNTFDARADNHRLSARSLLSAYAFLKYHPDLGDEHVTPAVKTRDSRAESFRFEHRLDDAEYHKTASLIPTNVVGNGRRALSTSSWEFFDYAVNAMENGCQTEKEPAEDNDIDEAMEQATKIANALEGRL